VEAGVLGFVTDPLVDVGRLWRSAANQGLHELVRSGSLGIILFRRERFVKRGDRVVDRLTPLVPKEENLKGALPGTMTRGHSAKSEPLSRPKARSRGPREPSQSPSSPRHILCLCALRLGPSCPSLARRKRPGRCLPAQRLATRAPLPLRRNRNAACRHG